MLDLVVICFSILTQHAHAEQGVMCSGLVSIYCMFVDLKTFESYFTYQLTFSNISGRTSRQIYRLVLPLLSPEMFSSSSK